jgi:NhaP-type Na+/H+ or K+/H+ antiporter
MLISTKIIVVGLVAFVFMVLAIKVMQKLAAKKSDSRTLLVLALPLFFLCFAVSIACMIYTAMLLFEMAKYAFS